MKKKGNKVEVFDFNKIKAYPYAKRDKNVLYSQSNFKVRIIELPPDGEMPTCKMDSYVIFYIFKGEVVIDINQEKKKFSEGQCFITEPATLSMRTKNGVKILGVQITQQ